MALLNRVEFFIPYFCRCETTFLTLLMIFNVTIAGVEIIKKRETVKK